MTSLSLTALGESNAALHWANQRYFLIKVWQNV